MHREPTIVRCTLSWIVKNAKYNTSRLPFVFFPISDLNICPDRPAPGALFGERIFIFHKTTSSSICIQHHSSTGNKRHAFNQRGSSPDMANLFSCGQINCYWHTEIGFNCDARCEPDFTTAFRIQFRSFQNEAHEASGMTDCGERVHVKGFDPLLWLGCFRMR